MMLTIGFRNISYRQHVLTFGLLCFYHNTKNLIDCFRTFDIVKGDQNVLEIFEEKSKKKINLKIDIRAN